MQVSLVSNMLLIAASTFLRPGGNSSLAVALAALFFLANAATFVALLAAPPFREQSTPVFVSIIMTAPLLTLIFRFRRPLVGLCGAGHLFRVSCVHKRLR